MSEPVQPFVLSDAAAAVVKSMLEKQGAALMLRIEVRPGGCRGFKYALTSDDRQRDGDALLDFRGARVVLDADSARYLSGARMDFVEQGDQRGFTIDNPNPSPGGGCGGGGCGGHGHGKGHGHAHGEGHGHCR